MKKIISIVAIIVIAISFNHLKAQNSLVNFEIKSNTLNVSGQDIAITSILSKEGNTLTWIQENNNATDISTFNINDYEGSWDQTNSTGMIRYELDIDGYKSYLILQRDSESLAATLGFYKYNVEALNYILTIDSITYQ
jgi:hypothetical protein